MFSIEDFRAFIATVPQDETWDYHDLTGKCPIAQYIASKGIDLQWGIVAATRSNEYNEVGRLSQPGFPFEILENEIIHVFRENNGNPTWGNLADYLDRIMSPTEG